MGAENRELIEPFREGSRSAWKWFTTRTCRPFDHPRHQGPLQRASLTRNHGKERLPSKRTNVSLLLTARNGRLEWPELLS